MEVPLCIGLHREFSHVSAVERIFKIGPQLPKKVIIKHQVASFFETKRQKERREIDNYNTIKCEILHIGFVLAQTCSYGLFITKNASIIGVVVDLCKFTNGLRTIMIFISLFSTHKNKFN